MDNPVTTPSLDRSHNNEQHTVWNGHAGHAWSELQRLLDDMFLPFEQLLLSAVSAIRPQRVLDVGCGTGATTLATATLLKNIAAQQAGTQENHRFTCTGIDISAPMLQVARQRAAATQMAAEFIEGDPQQSSLPQGSFDMIISRFGVMFFSNPAIAFQRLRNTLRAHGQLACIAWRAPQENPFMTLAERIAAPLLPPELSLPPRRSDAPGQFAFADPQRVTQILAASGWHKIHLHPLNISCTLPANQLMAYLTHMGPLGTIFSRLDAADRQHIEDRLHQAFSTYIDGNTVRYTAACWWIAAQANG